METKEHKKERYKNLGIVNAVKNKGKKPWITGKHHTIETRKNISSNQAGKFNIEIDKEQLNELYIIQKKTALECSKYFNCSEGCIVGRLKFYGIKQRNKSESKIKELNPMFNKHPHNYNKKTDIEITKRAIFWGEEEMKSQYDPDWEKKVLK